MIVFAQAHNDILDRSHTVAFSVAYGATQNLREIECLWSCNCFFHRKGMIAEKTMDDERGSQYHLR